MTVHRRHDLPPQPDLEVPLLSFIARHGGSISVSDYREKIKGYLADFFCVSEELLTEEIHTDSKVENRWWNHIRHCCRMLRRNGHLRPLLVLAKVASAISGPSANPAVTVY